jgi:hypothetical protein
MIVSGPSGLVSDMAHRDRDSIVGGATTVIDLLS